MLPEVSSGVQEWSRMVAIALKLLLLQQLTPRAEFNIVYTYANECHHDRASCAEIPPRQESGMVPPPICSNSVQCEKSLGWREEFCWVSDKFLWRAAGLPHALVRILNIIWSRKSIDGTGGPTIRIGGYALIN